MGTRMKAWGIGVALAVGAGLLLTHQVNADNSRVGTPPTIATGTFQTTGISTNTANLANIRARSAVFGFSVNATSANAQCGLYDSTTLGGAGMGAAVFIDEGGKATQWDTFQSNWPGPYQIINGLTVLVVNGTCIVYREPASFPS